ncbi:dipeptidase PepV [Atopobacter sp. AH10]|uniref:dipeptidase PepV n=1 Tax=Atopobacter sp. AH10 TaxID=2315861 RepID=UPI000EF1A9D8|nr:dipeptidase PepV [Atopobacter sp. AH10]RLK62436.1 dipeptidase PepV [Atopobacter sp. AH10]
MTIDWKKEVEQRREELLADLFDLLRVPSVREDDKATADAPVGPGPRAALEKFLSIAERDGFSTKNVDNLVGYLEFGQGDEMMGLLGHVDVVPVGTGWETDPFDPVIKDDRIYARGSSDDKGPTMACYYALKIIRDLGLPIKKRIRFIVGTDEETGWKCMDRYFKTEEIPDFGFSPDATFPIINGEKGNVTFQVSVKGEQKADAPVYLHSYDAGLKENMVPQDANAIVEFKDKEGVEKAFFDFVEANPISGTLEWNEDGYAEIQLVGKAAHGSTPDKGINAGTYLALYLNSLQLTGQAKQFVQLIAEKVHQNFNGDKLGVAHHDEVMGETSVNAGIITFTEESHGLLALNMRYPRGIEVETMEIGMEHELSPYGATIARGPHKEPHYVSPEDPLVKTLLDVYAKQTGLVAHEQSIGGGTYGRLMKRGVAYGALFPDSIDTMHQANEFMALDDLFRAAAIYAEAIYELVKE